MDNDTRTPRDRISKKFMRQLFESEISNEEDRMDESGTSDETEQVLCQRPDTRMKEDCTLGDRPLAMVYSPCQKWRELYDPETGFSRGTIFKELDMPFYGDRYGMKRKSEDSSNAK